MLVDRLDPQTRTVGEHPVADDQLDTGLHALGLQDSLDALDGHLVDHEVKEVDVRLGGFRIEPDENSMGASQVLSNPSVMKDERGVGLGSDRLLLGLGVNVHDPPNGSVVPCWTQEL